MIRRSFLKCAGALVPVMAWPELTRAAQATPGAEAADGLPELTITLTDTGFEVAQPLRAGRYHVIATNSGTATDSHFGLGKIPDEITDAQYQAFLQSEEGTDDLAFEDIAFVGAPDWPSPGGRRVPASGVWDAWGGRTVADAQSLRVRSVGVACTNVAGGSDDVGASAARKTTVDGVRRNCHVPAM